MANSDVDQHVDVGKWELIFWAGFIKISEVDAASYFVRSFSYEDIFASQVGCWMRLMKPTSRSI